MHTLIAIALFASIPKGEDFPPPPAALTTPSSARLALPVTVRFDEAMQTDISPLVKKDSGASAGSSREPVYALARFSLGVARRHFEDAKWADKNGERTLVVKSVAVTWTDGPRYEVSVVVDRYEGDHRLGQATGTGYGMGDRTAQRQGAAFAGPFGGMVHNEASQAKAEDDGVVIRQATVQALDTALNQLSAYWNGEQMQAKARADAEAMIKAAQQPPAKKKK